MSSYSNYEEVREHCEEILRSNLLTKIDELRAMYKRIDDVWYEDRIYRFYHHSFKIYDLQYMTLQIVELLKSLVPGRELNEWFMQIVREGTGTEFQPEHNHRWLEVTRPMVEAYMHARYFIEMAIKYHDEKREQYLPSGWAALLYLYDIR